MKLKRAFCLLAAAGLAWSSLAVPALAQESSQADSASLPPADSAGVNLKEGVKSRLERLQAQRREIENKVKERRVESSAKTEAKKEKVAQAKRKLEAARAERVKASVRRMSARFEAALNRLDNLAGRISARLDKRVQDGKDVSASRTALASAQAKVESAKTKLAETKAALEMVADSENPKEDFEGAKTKLNEVKTAVKEAHAALVGVVNSIKGASQK